MVKNKQRKNSKQDKKKIKKNKKKNKKMNNIILKNKNKTIRLKNKLKDKYKVGLHTDKDKTLMMNKEEIAQKYKKIQKKKIKS